MGVVGAMIRRCLAWLCGWYAVANAAPLAATDRHPHWPGVRWRHLLNHPECAACGTRLNLEVHHILPVSWPGGRELELDPTNLITLCGGWTDGEGGCHRRIGHLWDWNSYNPNVETDAAIWLNKIRNRPRKETV